jgi:integrase
MDKKTINRAAVVSVRFQLSNAKKPQTSLKCLISVSGHRATEFVVCKGVTVKFWAQKLQKMLDDSAESRLINDKLSLIKLDIQKAEMRLRIDGKLVTAHSVKTAYLEAAGITPKNQQAATVKPSRPTFQDCFDRFYERKAANKRKPVTDRTKESYFRYKSNLMDYTGGRYRKLYADELTHVWAESYLNWLIDSQGFTVNYANNNVNLIKSVLKQAEETGLIDRNPIKGFSLSDTDNYDTTHLTMTEVEVIANADFGTFPISPETAHSLREEADCFLFTCFTGQHHSDLQKRAFEVFVHPQDGRKWVRDTRTKTGNVYLLPLHPIALGIIEKYGGIDKLPVKANAKRNTRLKQIATFCGINKLLTTKIGRKTFANYALNVQRMRQETVAAILGHKSSKYVKYYAKITEESIAAEYRF